MKWFTGCESMDELKAKYRKLAMKWHPDMGGDTRIMQEINAEYDDYFRRAQKANNERAERGDEGYRKNYEAPNKYREIIVKLVMLDGVIVNVVGSWLWISGDTRKHKDSLKAYGCKWSNGRKMWYWVPYNMAPQAFSGIPMETLESTYGVTRYKAAPSDNDNEGSKQGIKPR